jgi:hypothetical protein
MDAGVAADGPGAPGAERDQHESRPGGEPAFGHRLVRLTGVEPGQVLIARLHHVGERHPLGEPPEIGGAVGDQTRSHVRVEGHQSPARLPANQPVERGGQRFEQQAQ